VANHATSGAGGGPIDVPPVVELADPARRQLVDKKVACPFLGPLVVAGRLSVHQDASKPLAQIADVTALGNTGGGSLGDVLEKFAQGNHAFMPGPSGALDVPAPAGFFSLDLPGSQGSHPGHSGILQGNPKAIDSGRFDAAAFQRLTSLAKDGVIKRSDVGRFIAHNVSADPAASVFPASRILVDVAHSALEAPRALFEWVSNKVRGEQDEKEQRELLQKLTKASGESNLIGSCGEYGLLFAFFEHKPGSRIVDGEPTVSVDDIRLMFEQKKLPDGWDTWLKTSSGWTKNTLALVKAATTEVLATRT
jgi:hypothetical protein